MASGSTTFDAVLSLYVSETGSTLANLAIIDAKVNHQGTYTIITTLYALLGSLVLELIVFAIVIATFTSYVSFIFIPLSFLYNGLMKRFSKWFL